MTTSGRANLVASHPGNTNAVRHGVFSERALVPRAAQVAEALMELPHAQPIDAVAAAEIGSLVARIEAIDADLDQRGHFGKAGAVSGSAKRPTG